MSFLAEKELFIFDMDGTLYLGDQILPCAVEFIKKLRAAGKKVIFYTNNSTRGSADYLERLERLGFEPSQQEIMSSGDVTAEFLLRERKGKKVFLVGTPELERDYAQRGIVLSRDADIVVSAFDTTLTYEKTATACKLIYSGAEFFSTHMDTCCPTDTGFVPDSGAIAALLAAATGKKPRFFGKPDGTALDIITANTGITRDKMCMFGDRLYTDIAFGKNNGVTAVLVLTGEATLADAAACPAASRPDYIFPTLEQVCRAMGM